MLFWLAMYGQTRLNRYCWNCGEINEFEISSHLLNPFLKGEQHIVGITFVIKTSEEGGSQNSQTVAAGSVLAWQSSTLPACCVKQFP